MQVFTAYKKRLKLADFCVIMVVRGNTQKKSPAIVVDGWPLQRAWNLCSHRNPKGNLWKGGPILMSDFEMLSIVIMLLALVVAALKDTKK